MLKKLTVIIILLIVLITVSSLPGLPGLALGETKEVTIDFDDVDIRIFIRVISEITGKNFIVDNNVKGKVTIISPKKLTARQAYEVFESVLTVYGFAIVETGQISKIVSSKGISGQALPLSTQDKIKGVDHFITQVVAIEYLDAKSLQALVKPILSRDATVIATPSSDFLVITDTTNNIRKIIKLLDEVDIDLSDELIERVDLKYSTSDEVAKILTEILNAKHGKKKKGVKTILYKIIPLERINAVIAVAPQNILSEINSIIPKIDYPTPEGKSLLNVYYLENASAEEMAQILTSSKEGLAKIASNNKNDTRQTPNKQAPKPKKTEGGGITTGTLSSLGEEITITADKATNSLVIIANPEQYESVKTLIKKLDIPRKQVYIEALIIEVSPNEQFDFGSEWQVFEDTRVSSKDAAVLSSSKNSGALDALFTTASSTALGDGFSLGMIAEQITIGGYTFPTLGVLVRAVETLDTINVLSRPQLMTLNNEAATINISENRPFQTSTTYIGDTNTTANFEYRDVGINLEITPHINKSGIVRLEIFQEVNRLSSLISDTQPVTRKRVISTVVEVKNKGTIIIGGLIEEETNYSKGQVPCLGGLPLAGWAFKSVGKTDNRKNLLVFISPKVFGSIEDANEMSKEKMELLEKERLIQKKQVEKEQPFFRERYNNPQNGNIKTEQQ